MGTLARGLILLAPPLSTDGPRTPSWTANDQVFMTGINFPTTVSDSRSLLWCGQLVKNLYFAQYHLNQRTEHSIGQGTTGIVAGHREPAFCYNAPVMLDTYLVPQTTIHGKGDGPSVDISSASSRVFLLTLDITNIVEQESLDISIYGSADGATWGAKPVAAFPQKFYRGQHPLLVDLSGNSAVKSVRAHWEAVRWGRGTETPVFEFNLTMKEIPPEILKEAAAQAKALV